MQYTFRRIPEAIDAAMRRRARVEGESLNEVAVEALAEGLGLSERDVLRRDVSALAGTRKKDSGAEAALADQDRVDEDLWR